MTSDLRFVQNSDHNSDNVGMQAQDTAPAASIGYVAVDVSYSFAAERRSPRSRDGVSLHLSDSPSASAVFSRQSDNSYNSPRQIVVATDAAT